MGVTLAAYAAKVAQFLSDYSGALAGLAAITTIVCGIISVLKKQK